MGESDEIIASKNRRIRRSVIVLLSSTAAHGESLKAAVRHALGNHPEIAALTHNKNAIKEELVAAKGLWLPKVDFVGKAGGYLNRKTRQGAYEVSAVLSQPLFDGGWGSSERERQSQRVKSAQNRVADTANAIALRVT